MRYLKLRWRFVTGVCQFFQIVKHFPQIQANLDLDQSRFRSIQVQIYDVGRATQLALFYPNEVPIEKSLYQYKQNKPRKSRTQDQFFQCNIKCIHPIVFKSAFALSTYFSYYTIPNEMTLCQGLSDDNSEECRLIFTYLPNHKQILSVFIFL